MPTASQSNSPLQKPEYFSEAHVGTSSPDAAIALIKKFWLRFSPMMVDEDTDDDDLLGEWTCRVTGLRTQVIESSTVMIQSNRDGRNIFSADELAWIRTEGGAKLKLC